MSIEFKLPELGEGVDSADVSRVFVEEGDEIQADQAVMELETEKAVADLPCPHSGKVSKIHVSAGDTIEVGQLLLTIEEVASESEQESPPEDQGDEGDDGDKAEAAAAGENGERRQAEADKSKKEATEQAQDAVEQARPAKSDRGPEAEEEDEGGPKTKRDEARENGEENGEEPSDVDDEKSEDQTDGKGKRKREEDESRRAASKDSDSRDLPPPAGPATRRLARKLNVDLDDFQVDEGGRIQQEDVVRAFVESGRAAALLERELPDFEKDGPTDRQPWNKIARTSAQRLANSWRTIPHVTQHGLADITDLEAARRDFQNQNGPADPKITLTAIAAKAVVGVLKQLPKFNSSVDVAAGELVVKKYFHVGIAVDTDHGLLVPVVRNADRKSLLEIAGEVAELASKARKRRLSQEDLQGGTFTISNQGGIGGDHFTPIVNWPEVAILGLGRARPQWDLQNGQPRERLKLPLSLSYDHRAVNGADAAKFVDLLEEALSGTFEFLVSA